MHGKAIVLIASGALAASIGIAGCGTTTYYNKDGNGEAKPAKETKKVDRTDPSNYPITNEQIVADEWSTKIIGTVTNNSGERASYVQVDYSLYDETGAKIGSAMANISGLEAGERWNFEAMSLESNVASYKLDKMEIW